MITETNVPAQASDEPMLPCPFCGNSDAFVERLDYSSAYVQCDGDVGHGCACQARGPIAVQDDDGEEIPGGAGAIAAWNTRAEVTLPADRVQVPQNAQQAHAMYRLAQMWLTEHKPPPAPAAATPLHPDDTFRPLQDLSGPSVRGENLSDAKP
jgi:hypothetical protein